LLVETTGAGNTPQQGSVTAVASPVAKQSAAMESVILRRALDRPNCVNRISAI
jgi:hypothetical protein